MSQPWIEEANKYLGQNRDNISDMLTVVKTGMQVSDDMNANTWDGLFVAFVFSQIGKVPVTSPVQALNWLSFGTVLTKPTEGCLVVFANARANHVGFYLGEDETSYSVLGGNQNDTVSVINIPKTGNATFVWPFSTPIT
jgi:uncharacterized protein (TIGR02594 family)